MIRFKLFIYFFTLFLNLYSWAQTPQKVLLYRGPLIISDSDSGQTIYNYYIDKNKKHIKHGYFYFKSETFKSSKRLIQKKHTGKFSHDLKDHDWTYSLGNYTVTIKTITDKLDVETDVEGSVSSINAFYKKGVPEGNWSYEHAKFVHKNVSHKTAEGKASFKEGKLSGPFQFNRNDGLHHYKIYGQFDHQGSFDGKWFMEYKIDTSWYQEERLYQNGFLLYLTVKTKHQKIPLYEIQYSGVQEKLHLLSTIHHASNPSFTIGEKEFGVLFDDGFHSHSKEIVSQLKGNELLEEALKVFVDTTRTSLLDYTGVIVRNNSPTKRFKYLYTQEEEHLLDATLEQIETYDSLLETYLNNITFAANKQRSDSLSFSRNLIEVGKRNFELLKNNVTLLKSEEFRYQSRENYFKMGIPGINGIDSIHYTYDGKENIKVLNSNINFSDEGGIINHIANYVSYYTTVYDTIFPFIDLSIEEIEKEQIDKQLEEQIVNYTDSLLSMYNYSLSYLMINGDSISSPYLKTIYTSIKSKIDEKTQHYSSGKTFEERQQRGSVIIDFCKVYLNAFNPMILLLKKTLLLDEAFTRYAYNPYTGKHDIKTRIKKNIHIAASEYLMPYYFEEFAKILDFNLVPSILEEAEKAYNRFIELSKSDDKETKSVDKKLKKETSPEKIKQIIFD